MTFEEYGDNRAQYSATLPVGDFAEALECDRRAGRCERKGDTATAWHNRQFRDAALCRVAVRSLRNQRQLRGETP